MTHSPPPEPVTFVEEVQDTIMDREGGLLLSFGCIQTRALIDTQLDITGDSNNNMEDRLEERVSALLVT